MTQANDNAFAFGVGEEIVAHGLSKREYFAAMALSGMALPIMPDAHVIEFAAETAAKYADALIEQLNK
jgi:hypothetical protein